MTHARTSPRASLASLGVMFFLIGAVNAAWIGRLPAISTALALTELELGLLLLAPAAGAMVVFRFAGKAIRRFGAARVARFATVAMSAALPWIGLAPSPLTAAVAFFVFGAASGATDVGINAYAVEVERSANLRVMGRLHAVVCVGRFAGGAACIATASSAISARHHVVMASAVALVLALVAFLAAGNCRADRPLTLARQERLSLERRSGARLLFACLAALCVCSSLCEGAMADWAAVYLHRELGAPESLAAVGYPLFSAGALLGRLGSDRISERMGEVALVRIGGVAVATAMGVGLVVNLAPAMLVAYGVVGLGVAGLVPLAFRRGARLSEREHGATIANLATASYLAFLGGPPLIGALASVLSLRGALGLVAATGLLIAALGSALAPDRGRPRAFAARTSPGA